tara:strand:+ start:17141 stop:17458 length:318 start_codon:yes stop_codon:yes gene_type:complete
MSQVQNAITEIFKQSLQPDYLEVLNESDQHSGPPGRETHFHVTIVTESFSEMGRIARHQRVYGLLKDYMQNPIHALSLHLFTPEEWQARGQASNASPECAGANKS